jgi:hypothetical protein
MTARWSLDICARRRRVRRLVPHVLPTPRMMKRRSPLSYDATSHFRGAEIVPCLEQAVVTASPQISLIRTFNGTTNCFLRPSLAKSTKGRFNSHQRPTRDGALHRRTGQRLSPSVSRSMSTSACKSPKLQQTALNVFKGAPGGAQRHRGLSSH